MGYGFQLGDWSRRITTASAEAQTWFDRGLNWVYGYNHEEAVACFRRALKADPGCAMAWWGIAYASGPFYNRPWIRFSEAEIAATLPVCFEAAQNALARAETATGAERGLITATALRFQAADSPGREMLEAWHRAFTDELGQVQAAHPTDLDLAALYAEAAVTCTPRQLWDLRKGVPKPGTLTEPAMAVLEDGLKRAETMGVLHPGLLHMMIHALEMSPFPERGLRAADLLRRYRSDAGHLAHMPAHIDVLVGDYARAVEDCRRSVVLDDLYVAQAGASNFYTTARCHDLHLLMYAAMFLGRYGDAIWAADRIGAEATPELVDASGPFMASILDGYAAMRTHVQVRFGRWRELAAAAAPEPHPRARIRTAMHWYGKGVAHSALGQVAEAEAAQAAFHAAVDEVPPEMVFLSNPVRVMLGVAEKMLEGELLYRKRDFDAGFAALREAVARDDALNYTEPWAWMHPPRHALGALLAEQGRFDEAESAYRADLGYDATLPRCCQHPDNVWALTGLLECVERTGDANEARLLRQRLTLAQARTDMPVLSACACRGAG